MWPINSHRKFTNQRKYVHVSIPFSTPLILSYTEAYENITQHIRHDLLSRDADTDGNLQTGG